MLFLTKEGGLCLGMTAGLSTQVKMYYYGALRMWSNKAGGL